MEVKPKQSHRFDFLAELLNRRKFIKLVDRFKYLGNYLARDDSFKLEFDERLKRARQAMGMLKNILE